MLQKYITINVIIKYSLRHFYNIIFFLGLSDYHSCLTTKKTTIHVYMIDSTHSLAVLWSVISDK